ncbi:hypothetical protein HBH56_189760 [Parastagonospora nodorum]|nr:hypothetical protein HBH56_189760 [Parastagonospora nodorum]KAH3925230.1 hypothetical protein HBH54_185570 [Parastagonospora nodorum]KAH4021956.1 hypothetical protein HBI09_174350 [Parastagonospora nodorum]KAH4131926.1 hypothetical protein HBH45_189560 [Parastagonospora nodorum]KAH4151771.1 hypothetical protein HBH44_167610 [Parastagonospora nodorum]
MSTSVHVIKVCFCTYVRGVWLETKSVKMSTEDSFVQVFASLGLNDTFGPGPGVARLPTSSANGAPLAARKQVQLHHPSAASAIKANKDVTLWLQQNRPDVLAQMAQQGNHANMGMLPANVAPPIPGVPVNFVAPQAPMVRHYGGLAKKLKHWNLQMTQQMIDANEQLFSADQELRSANQQVSDLKYQLVAQNGLQRRQNQKSSTAFSASVAYVKSPSHDLSAKRFAVRSNEPTLVAPSPTRSISASSSGPPATRTTPYLPSTPNQHAGKRHHRTATPEQREIRSIMQAPVYTLGMDPQTDRGLLSDFFEAIKNWASDYTVHLCTLSAEQLHNLAVHSAIASGLGPPSKLMMLVTEKDMLIAMVTAVVSRYIFARTIDEHGLYLSGHANAQITEQLAYEWTQLLPSEHEKKDELLQRQRAIYTAIKAQSDHKSWRTTCAQIFTDSLLSSLDGLLTRTLPPHVLKYRAHVIQELFVKGYRIGFRLRMAAVRWDFHWPLHGATFGGSTMVNESRMLYGDVMRTMREVIANEEEHVVRFSISPTIRKKDWGVGGGGAAQVVHSGLVLLTRRGWL